MKPQKHSGLLTISARIARLSLSEKKPDTGPVWWYLEPDKSGFIVYAGLPLPNLTIHIAEPYILAGFPSQPQ